MLAKGRLHPEQDSLIYIYRQIYMGHTSFGLLAKISVQVGNFIHRITTKTRSKNTKRHWTAPISILRPTRKSTWDRWWSATARIDSWRLWSKILLNKNNSFRIGLPPTAEHTPYGESKSKRIPWQLNLSPSTIFTFSMDTIACRLLTKAVFWVSTNKRKTNGYRH